MAPEFSVLGAVCVSVWSHKYLGLRDQCLACGGCLLGKWYAQKVPLFLCLLCVDSVVLGSTVELLRLCFELCFQLVVLYYAWRCVFEVF